MDKRVIFAVAGSGKTSYIVNKLTLEKKALIITYTTSNIGNLRRKIIEKFGFFPENITLCPYFSFLYSLCFKPLLSYKYQTKGVSFHKNPNRFARKDNPYDYFIDKTHRVYANRLVKFLTEENQEDEIICRVEKYFDEIYVDEVQDFAGHDFNFLGILSKLNMNVIKVGDFFQHTFDTSRDGRVNGNLHDNYVTYLKKFEDIGLTVDPDTLDKSWRCSPTVCDFVKTTLQIDIYSHSNIATQVLLFNDQDAANAVFHNDSIVKLFYESHYKYPCYSNNWGNSKGEDHYEDVCVVLTDNAFKLITENALHTLTPQTKNKLYVACTRTRKDLILVPANLFKKYIVK